MRLSRRTPRFLLLFHCTAAVLLAHQVQVSQPALSSGPWGDDVRTLAGKILTSLGAARSASLAVKNISALDAADSDAARQELQAELTRRGLQVTADSPAEAVIEVTLSQGAEGYVWVAQIHAQTGDEIVMVTARGGRGIQAKVKPVPVLRENLLLRRPETILDFAQTSGPDGVQTLLLLQQDRLALLQQNSGTWAMRGSVPIRYARAWPRDLRGRVVLSAPSEFNAFLPGVFCTGRWSAALAMNCREDSEATWSVGGSSGLSFVPHRNYLADPLPGVSRPRDDSPKSYSFASNSDEGPSSWILTKSNGNARLFENDGHAVATFEGWGDDIASIATECVAGWHILVTGSGDWNGPDRIQVYEIGDRQAMVVGQALEFPGPILALWSSDEGTSVRVVSRNLQTGMYEASIVSVSCGD